MADYIASTGIKLNVDTSGMYDFAKSADDLNASLTRTQKQLGLTYNSDKLLVNSFGQVVQGLSTAQIKAGNYVDELGRIRTFQGGFTDGLTSTQRSLGWYSDELGNVYDKLGNLKKGVDDASKQINASPLEIKGLDINKLSNVAKPIKEIGKVSQISLEQASQGVVGVASNIGSLASNFAESSVEAENLSAAVNGFVSGFGQIGALTQSLKGFASVLSTTAAASATMASANAVETASALSATSAIVAEGTALSSLTAKYNLYNAGIKKSVDASKILDLSRDRQTATLLKLTDVELRAIKTNALSAQSQTALAKVGLKAGNLNQYALADDAKQALVIRQKGLETAYLESKAEADKIVSMVGEKRLREEINARYAEELLLAKKIAAGRKAANIDETIAIKELKDKKLASERDYNRALTDFKNAPYYLEQGAAQVLIEQQNQMQVATQRYNDALRVQGTTLQKLNLRAKDFIKTQFALGSSFKNVAKGALSLNGAMIGAGVAFGLWQGVNSLVDKHLGRIKQALDDYKALELEAKRLGKTIAGVSNYRAFQESMDKVDVRKEFQRLTQDVGKYLDDYKDKELGFWNNVANFFTWGGHRRRLAAKAYEAETAQATQRLAEKTQSYIDDYKSATSNERTETLKKIDELESLIRANSDLETKQKLNFLLRKAQSDLTNATITSAKAMWDKQQEIKNARLDFAGLSQWVEGPIKWGSVDVRVYQASIKRFGQALQNGWINQYEYNKAVKDYSKSVQEKFLQNVGLDVSYLDASKKLNEAGQKLIEARNASYINETVSAEIAKRLKNQYRDSMFDMVGYSDVLLDAEKEIKKYAQAVSSVATSLNKNDISIQEANYLFQTFKKSFKESILDEIGVEWKSKNQTYLSVLAKLNEALNKQLINQDEYNELQAQNLTQARKELAERLNLNDKSDLFETIEQGEVREFTQKQKELNLQIDDLRRSMQDGVISQAEFLKYQDQLKNKISMEAAIDLGWEELRDATKRPLTEFEKLNRQLASFERALERGEINQDAFNVAQERVAKRMEQEGYKKWKEWKEKYRGELGIDSLIDESRSSLSKYQETLYKITGSLNNGYITVLEANMLGQQAYNQLYESLNQGFGQVLTKTVNNFEAGSESLYQQRIKQSNTYQDTMRGTVANLLSCQKSMLADIAHIRRLQEQREEYVYETYGQYM